MASQVAPFTPSGQQYVDWLNARDQNAKVTEVNMGSRKYRMPFPEETVGQVEEFCEYVGGKLSSYSHGLLIVEWRDNDVEITIKGDKALQAAVFELADSEFG